MSHVDEGLIHAWLEDQLSPDEAARVEQLVATDAAWSAAAAEARGMIAASSRVLGALDSAPSAGATPIPARTERTRRSESTGKPWARKDWLRAAAAIVLVGGISGVWFSGTKDVLDFAAKQEKATDGVGGPPPVAESQSSAVQQTSPRSLPVTPQAPAADGRRAGSREPERRSDSPPPVATAPPPPPPAVAAVRDEAGISRSAAVAKDTGEARAVGGVGGVVAGAGGGRGGRGATTGAAFEAASVSAQRSEVPRSELMKSLATAVDSVQRGCWVSLETPPAPPQSRVANESARSSTMVLRFVPPVVTDLAVVPAPALSRASVPPPGTPASALRAAPANARMQHTTARAKDDSTLVAEWYDPDGRRTQLTFRVRGDTLRGTTNTTTGEVVIAGPVLVAVRTQCPPAAP